jgi:hypothetical protein
MVNRESYRTEEEALKALERYRRMKEREQVIDAWRGTPWREGKYVVEVVLR